LSQNKQYQAKIAALSIAQAQAMVKLLRAHGRSGHAQNVESALQEVSGIVAAEVGTELLSEAMSWVAEQTWDVEGAFETSQLSH
jgi:hypothetical protein